MGWKLNEPLDGLKSVSWSKLIDEVPEVKQQNRSYFESLGIGQACQTPGPRATLLVYLAPC